MKSGLITNEDAMLRFQNAAAMRDTRTTPSILLVEDELVSVRLMEIALNAHYTIAKALRACIGWETYLATAPDIVFLDIDMPEINGHQLAAAIHALDPNAYIVMVTAHHITEQGAQAKRNGVKDFITKPYSKKKIRDALDKFYALHPTRNYVKPVV